MSGLIENDPRTWNWEGVVKQCELVDSDAEYRTLYLGTVMGNVPSGKYWTCWANNNVTEEEMEKDDEWMELLNECADAVGGWIECGEGDPCDLFFCMPREDEEDEEE